MTPGAPQARPERAARRLTIAILTMGSRGDVEPYLGLGAALARSGHDVTIAASAAFEPLAAAAGLRTFRVGPDPRLRSVNGEPPRWLGSSAIGDASRLRAAAGPDSGLPRLYREYLAASGGAEVLLYPLWLGPVAQTIAQISGGRALPAFLAPAHPTRTFPSPYLPVASRPGWNRLTHRLALRLGAVALYGAPNAWRRSTGLPPASAALLTPDDGLCLYGFSPTLVARPPDWPERAVITGTWWLDTPEDWRPPESLRRFLDRPGKVIFLGMGSMMDGRPGRLNEIVRHTLDRLGCRAVLLGGPRGLLELPHSARWLTVRDVPFDWLFPRLDAIVHHGGAGTTAQAARSGKPSFAIPYFADQLWWARRIHVAGGGPTPIPRRRLTAAGLTSRIDRALHDPRAAEQAAILGSRVRAEPGASAAVGLIESALAV